jgi:V8-like Glu-specific endopeptidase
VIKDRAESTERDWLAELRDAARTFDWDRVREISREYVGHLAATAEPASAEVENVLRFLREHLRREDMRDVADAALTLAMANDTVIRLQYAQALVDSGSPSGALMMYEGVLSEAGASERDRAEASGGVGRCEKQRFLTTTEPGRRQRHLLRSIHAYGAAYRETPESYWHGINFVAMLARGLRDGFVADATDVSAAARASTQAVLSTVRGSATPEPWQRATECEALIALGRHEEAVSAAAAFVADPATTSFMMNALLRQLLDVWELDTRTPPGASLLPVLRSALLTRHGGRVVVATEDVRVERVSHETNPRLEKVLGHSRYRSLAWYRKGLARCRAVARVETTVEDGIGTGFLVHGPDLHPGLPKRVLVTNAHVVPEGLAPDSCVVAFHGLDADAEGPRAFEVRRLIWSRPSKDGNLDTTILELDGVPPNVEPMSLASTMPALAGGQQRAYVIGHPRGLEQPQFSLQDNVLLDWDDRLVHYRSPTEGGSSGSPVFNGEWLLIGLHHAGSFETSRLHGQGGTYAANEAISVDAIRAGLLLDPPVVG